MSFPIKQTIKGLEIRPDPNGTSYSLHWIKDGSSVCWLMADLSMAAAQRAMGLFLEALDWETAPLGATYPLAAVDHKTQVRLAHVHQLLIAEGLLSTDNFIISSSAERLYKSLLEEDPR